MSPRDQISQDLPLNIKWPKSGGGSGLGQRLGLPTFLTISGTWSIAMATVSMVAAASRNWWCRSWLRSTSRVPATCWESKEALPVWSVWYVCVWCVWCPCVVCVWCVHVWCVWCVWSVWCVCGMCGVNVWCACVVCVVCMCAGVCWGLKIF